MNISNLVGTFLFWKVSFSVEMFLVFKGSVSKDFRPLVFIYQSNSPRPLANGLERFEYGVVFAGIFDKQ
jgi:hypothetical protein